MAYQIIRGADLPRQLFLDTIAYDDVGAPRAVGMKTDSGVEYLFARNPNSGYDVYRTSSAVNRQAFLGVLGEQDGEAPKVLNTIFQRCARRDSVESLQQQRLLAPCRHINN